MKKRRDFLIQFIQGTGLMVLTGLNLVASENESITETEISPKKKLGIALVGLGNYSEKQLAPSLEQTEYCRLAGIVTGTPDKAQKWKKKYDIPDGNIYNYENFDTIKDNKDIDIIYVVLPTALHAEYVIKAAKAGKHVICEKPMAMNANECEQMIKACKDAGKMLSIGYRLHFDTYNMEIKSLGRDKPFGKIKYIKTENSEKVKDGSWRLVKKMGGGPMMDMGIYCVQGCQYATGKIPIAVTATEGEKTDPEKFKEVEESMTWKFEFADGTIADCQTNYVKPASVLRIEAEKGWYELEPAYPYEGQKLETSNGKMKIPENPKKQQAMQIDDFAKCILNNTPTKVSGEMGMKDIKIVTAIFEAAKTGKRIPIEV